MQSPGRAGGQSGVPGHAGAMRALKPRADLGGRVASRAIAPESQRPTDMPSSQRSPSIGAVEVGVFAAGGVAAPVNAGLVAAGTTEAEAGGGGAGKGEAFAAGDGAGRGACTLGWT
ncbi:MAG: hypothetical protein HIU92_17735 [Proteobacteria bacterium]|nr:hypothetical protein [Pseudomonadota bacterium]